MAQQALPQPALPVSALPATISPAIETCSFIVVASSSFSSSKKGGLQQLVDSGRASPMVDPGMIPNTDQYLPGAPSTLCLLRSLVARVVSYRNGEAHNRCGEHCTQTTRGEHVCNVGIWSWLQSAVFVGRSSKRGRDNICVSCADSKGRKLPIKSRP